MMKSVFLKEIQRGRKNVTKDKKISQTPFWWEENCKNHEGGGKNLTYSFVTKSIFLKEVTEVQELLQKCLKGPKLPSKNLLSGKKVQKS